ncbi:hypothetical protein [Salinarimonas soli]|uniref:Uncharacterized protein n=1 Tax=Salinarimonas soli TaxID=1638099 RepID=A0A5B2VGQ8_9HYPH|nr:hypothetical protein [Salinarimonas soli]KAA2237522.1 hypothetical protein F0L46_11080 [Salinarimonas soli]
MTKLLALVSVLALTALPGAPLAGEIAPRAGESLSLGSVSGTLYYTVEDNGFRVVATLAAEDAAPVRFVTTLQPGQTATISVPRGPEESALEIEIARIGQTLQVAKAQKLSSLN